MPIQFVTGNKNKFNELQAFLEIPLQQVSIDLPEIQDIDPHTIIREKLLAAEAHATGAYIVEDTSLYLDCLKGGLPGPFIKWFEKTLSNEGIVELTQKYDNNKAEAVTLIGYLGPDKDIHFFEGRLKGNIVPVVGDKDFGWGPIFKPEGQTKTFGEMEAGEKREISMRSISLSKLKEFLQAHS